MFKLILTLMLATGCAVSTDPAPSTDPDCNPGSPDVRVLSTPIEVTEISDELATEYQVSGCVEMSDPAWVTGDDGRVWCCWKSVVV